MPIKRRMKLVEDNYLNELLNDMSGLGKLTLDQVKQLEQFDPRLKAPYTTWLGGRYYVKQNADSRWEYLPLTEDPTSTS